MSLVNEIQLAAGALQTCADHDVHNLTLAEYHAVAVTRPGGCFSAKISLTKCHHCYQVHKRSGNPMTKHQRHWYPLKEEH